MSQPDDVLARLAALEQEIARLHAVVADVAQHHRPAPAPSESEWVAEWGDVEAAQKLLRCSRTTALLKIKAHGFGHVIDRRWWIDLARIRAHLDGRPFPPLARAL